MSLLRVGILMGGRSIEREVSLNSGRTICDHLDTARYTVIPIFQTISGQLYILPWHFLHRGKIADFEHRLADEAQAIMWDDLKSTIDFCFIALHGRYGEDGCIQGILEILHIPYFGSKVLASALGMDKPLQKKILEKEGIVVPRGITIPIHKLDFYKKESGALLSHLTDEGLAFPLIVKPAHEGSSLGVTKVFCVDELAPALEKASSASVRGLQDVIIEEMIKGMEFSCIVITDYKTGRLMPLPPTEVVIEENSTIFDYDQKYMPGRATKYTPARCTESDIKRLQDVSIQVMNILGFKNLGRIDGFLSVDGRVVITDPNSFSGMSPSSYAFLQAAEIDMTHTGFINHLIETELKAYGMLDENNTVSNSTASASSNPSKKLRVGVLLGGATNEKEISLESGRNVCYKLSPHKYDVTPLFVTHSLDIYALNQKLLVRNKTSEIEAAVTPDIHIPWSKLPELFDFIFIGLHGGVGENGAVQGMLEMLDLPYNGSPVLASALCADKYKTNEFLASCGFHIPHHHLLSKREWDEKQIVCPFNFPVIIKPHDDGCSVLVQRATTSREFTDAINQVFASGKDHALIEEMIIGTEVTIGVIGNEHAYALPPSQSIAAKGILSIEEKFLPGAGENQTPALLPQPAIQLIQTTASGVYEAIGCRGYVRIDCFYQSAEESPTKEPRVVILEINTLPGLTPATCLFHQAAEVGIKTMDFIDLIVQLGMELHTQKPYLSPEQRTIFKAPHHP